MKHQAIQYLALDVHQSTVVATGCASRSDWQTAKGRLTGLEPYAK